MDERSITLHIGLPKTATTTIQRHLYRNANYLLELGIDYCADLCHLGMIAKASAHHALARTYCMNEDVRLSSETIEAIRRRLSGPGRYLLSSEVFSRGNKQAALKFVEECELPIKRQIVLSTRSELSYIQSHWMQSIKVGKRCDSLWEYYSGRYKPSRRSYSDKLQGWVDAGFSVNALRYEELQASPNVTQAVLKTALDQEIDGDQWQAIKNANVSPDYDAVAHYQRILAPIHSCVAPKVNQRKAAKWYKGLHDIVCHSPFIQWLGESNAYREDVKRITDDLAALPSIDDLTYRQLD